MFALVMQDKEICKRFLERIFDGKVVKELVLKSKIDLDKFEATIEKTIINDPNAKSVRLDVLFEGDNTWYDIEMQSEQEYFSPKRMRYYSSSMDINQLDKGYRNYEKLKTNYVIFICDFDYYNMDEAIYLFQYYDKEKDLDFGDGTYMIMLNAKCSPERIPEQLKKLYRYIDKDIVDLDDELIKDMDVKVAEYSEDRRVKQIMTLADEMIMEQEKKYELGVKDGITQGIIHGKLEDARNMKADSMPIDLIAKYTGLDKEEIEKL